MTARVSTLEEPYDDPSMGVPCKLIGVLLHRCPNNCYPKGPDSPTFKALGSLIDELAFVLAARSGRLDDVEERWLKKWVRGQVEKKPAHLRAYWRVP